MQPMLPAPKDRLRALFGTSLFGNFDVRTRVEPSPLRIEQRSEVRRRWLTMAIILALLASSGASVVRAGIARRATVDIDKEAESIARAIESGSVEQVAALIPRLEQLTIDSGADLAHRMLLARAEATVFRSLDPDPARRARAELLLSAADAGGDDAIITRGLLTSDRERTALIPELERVALARPRDPEPAFLIALALEAAGQAARAEAAFRDAEAREPTHLPHLEEHVAFLLRIGRTKEAIALVEHMTDVQPSSIFTERARSKIASMETPVEPPPPVKKVIKKTRKRGRRR